MDAPPTVLQPKRPVIRRRRRAWLIAALVGAALSVLLWRCATGVRQSAARSQVHATLQSVAQAANLYKLQFSASPAIDDLRAAGMLDAAALRGFSRCESSDAPGTPPAIDAWLVQTVPCRAVRMGEAWGGPGDTIDHDLPPCRFVLMKDWSVRQIDEPDFQRDLARRVRLTPLR